MAFDTTVAFKMSPRLRAALEEKAREDEQTISGWLRALVKANVQPQDALAPEGHAYGAERQRQGGENGCV